MKKFFAVFLTLFALSPLTFGTEFADRYAISADKNIMRSEHLGLTNHHATFGTPYETVGRIDGFWAPPFVASDFSIRTTLDAEPVPVSDYTWRPTRFQVEGVRDDWRLTSEALLAAGERTGILKLRLENRTKDEKTALLAIEISAPTLDRSDVWEFPTETSRTPSVLTVGEGQFRFERENLSLAAAASGWTLSENPSRFERSVTLAGGEAREFYAVFALGETDEARRAVSREAKTSEQTFERSLEVHNAELAALYDRLPRLESDNPLFVKFYDRSLLHFFMNRWDVPEFILHPYYSTGSVRGGCLCSYLWNFGEPWEILPLYDPDAARSAIAHYLSIDLTRHYAFRPTTGEACGPWYMINQEKIIGLIYYYVRLTSDRAFLEENVAGRSVCDHLIEQAYLLDDPRQPVALIDYGVSNSHLELRRDPNLYNHIMPDLNGRRYANYLRASELLEIAGHPESDLVRRAGELKSLLKKELWNPATRWFDCPDAEGNRRTRWTIQMFKLFDSGVLDAEQEAGLLSHWNESEFLGPFGVHSLAKGDEWYDPNDVDNGGPGACTDFGPQIAERFFRSGHGAAGADILRRLLWLGEAMPYWGDSVYADRADYRRDTPLQCMYDSVTIAQSIIFGLFGVSRSFDGSIAVRPYHPDFAQTATLRDVKIGSEVFDVTVDADGFEILYRNRKYRGLPGQTATIRGGAVIIDGAAEAAE